MSNQTDLTEFADIYNSSLFRKNCKFADIYDMLNEQPHLQEIIRQSYYDDVLREESKENKSRVIDQLNYVFKNVRIHQIELFGDSDEEYILGTMKEFGGFDNIVRTTENSWALPMLALLLRVAPPGFVLADGNPFGV
jgi:hypothetical protein